MMAFRRSLRVRPALDEVAVEHGRVRPRRFGERRETTYFIEGVHGHVSRLKRDVAGEIRVAGSIQLAQSLLAHDRVDEIHLMTSAILEHGHTLWTKAPEKAAWTLTEATVCGDSPLITTYRRR